MLELELARAEGRPFEHAEPPSLAALEAHAQLATPKVPGTKRKPAPDAPHLVRNQRRGHGGTKGNTFYGK